MLHQAVLIVQLELVQAWSIRSRVHYIGATLAGQLELVQAQLRSQCPQHWSHPDRSFGAVAGMLHQDLPGKTTESGMSAGLGGPWAHHTKAAVAGWLGLLCWCPGCPGGQLELV